MSPASNPDKTSIRWSAEVRFCNVLLGLIGPSWASASDGDGQRRLDDPQSDSKQLPRCGLYRSLLKAGAQYWAGAAVSGTASRFAVNSSASRRGDPVAAT
jgi:hypothetical protein